MSRGTGPVSIDSKSRGMSCISRLWVKRYGFDLRVGYGYGYKIPTICSNSYFTILRQNKCCSFLTISVTILDKGRSHRNSLLPIEFDATCTCFFTCIKISTFREDLKLQANKAAVLKEDLMRILKWRPSFA